MGNAGNEWIVRLGNVWLQNYTNLAHHNCVQQQWWPPKNSLMKMTDMNLQKSKYRSGKCEFCYAAHPFFLLFRVVHRSCVDSEDQVDACRETKYLSSSKSMWNTDSRCWASYAMGAKLVPSKLAGTLSQYCIHVLTVTVRTHSSLLPLKDSFLSYRVASSIATVNKGNSVPSTVKCSKSACMGDN